MRSTMYKGVTLVVLLCLIFLQPAAVFAQAMDATGAPTGAPEQTTGAPACTGAGCGQGANQGAGQGEGQGGTSAADLGRDAEGNLPADTRQGAQQGAAQGSGANVAGSNTGTGAGSTNAVDVDANAANSTSVDNTATNTTNGTATGTTGGNTSSSNTGNGTIGSGNAGIGVTQVVNDNSTTLNGSAGLTVQGHQGNHEGDLTLGFGAGTANLSGSEGSVRATNETTGADSTNSVDVATRTETLTEVQNDGRIDNILDLAAITGQNTANRNTGNGSITTGDADVAATLINLLNTTVINGDLWVTVADIFGDLAGDIHIPDLANFLSPAARAALAINAANTGTGADSTNAIDVDVTERDATTITNDAEINTTVNANAITGQNEATANTGGSTIATGDATVSASNVSVANTTVDGGNWGLFIVNALNGWLGFMVGDQGQVQALSQEETLQHIDAQNSNTGSNSDNTIDVEVTEENETNIENDAQINNVINASAITGQNEASRNTGAGAITTGNANIQATAVNIANTTVRNGSLFIAVVNVFGDWFGDLFYNGSSLAAAAAGPAREVVIDATNSETGANSDNTVDVTVDSQEETTITNDADINTTLNANIDTGNNRANRNTQGAAITTGNGHLALNARAVANLTGIGGPDGLSVSVTGLNEETGFESENRIRARINDERVWTIDNEANITTEIGSVRQPSRVNTGDNEANQNTLGAVITTGSASAEIAIQNLVNQVVIALTDAGVAVDTDLRNQLTGAFSENINDVTVTRNRLLTILNEALVDNIINLLLNTGGNRANENTGGGAISTGAICVDGRLENVVNTTSGAGVSLILDATGNVNNEANIAANTGLNQLDRNTGGSAEARDSNPCVIAHVPPAQPTPTPGPTGGGNGGGGEGGGGEEAVGGGEAEAPTARERVAAAVSALPAVAGGPLLKRFPVAGSDASAWLNSRARLPWQMFVLVSLAVMGTAYSFDRRARVRA